MRGVARIAVGLAVLGITCCLGKVVSPRPNFIVIFADDLGYGDLGCYGNAVLRTPNLDRLAAEGMRFTDFYAGAPFCSPSRASILTGRYPVRAGVPSVLFPQEKTGLAPGEITFAELLKARGYATACVGKWHLGFEPPMRPTAQGFDAYLGLPYSNDSFKWDGKEPPRIPLAHVELPLIDGEEVIEAPVDQTTLTIRYTERAIRFIREHKDVPFALYLPHTFPHSPQYASPRFDGKSAGGIYGDSVEELDWSVGEVVGALRELGIADRTLVIFTSDNGPAKGGGLVTDGKERWHGGWPGPLRGYKGTTSEGGVRVPAIFWWPGRIAGGVTCGAIASVLDVMPTLAGFAGVALPDDRVIDGADLGPLLVEGEPGPMGERQFCYYFGAQLQAVRRGRWKLILPIKEYPEAMPPTLWYALFPKAFRGHYRLHPEAALYDLESDAGETRDVSREHPDRVEALLRAAREFDRKLQADKRPQTFLGPTRFTPDGAILVPVPRDAGR